MTDSRSLKREVHTKHFITSPVSAFHAVCESLVVGNNKTLHHGGLSERNLSYFPKAVCIGAEQCTADIKKKKKVLFIYLFPNLLSAVLQLLETHFCQRPLKQGGLTTQKHKSSLNLATRQGEPPRCFLIFFPCDSGRNTFTDTYNSAGTLRAAALFISS